MSNLAYIKSLIIMLILISLLVIIHELGHFLAGKLFKMKIDKVGMGLPIGPTLFQKKIGDITFYIHAFLFGGYVSFPDDSEDCDLPKDSPDRFLNRPIYQRAIVCSAGVIFNVIFAYLIVLFAAFHWGYMPTGSYDVYVNEITAPKTASIWQSGMQNNDKILYLNGTSITNTNSLVSIINLSKSYDGKYNKTQANELLAILKEENIAISADEVIPKGVTIKLPNVKSEAPISFVKEEEKGIVRYENDDEVLSEDLINLRNEIKGASYFTGNEKYTLRDLSLALADTYHPLNFTVLRNGKIINLKPIQPDENGKIGISFESKKVLTKTKGFKSIVKSSSKYLIDNTYYMVYGLSQLFTGRIPLKDMHGVVAVTKVGGDIIKNNGLFYGLLLTAIISMDLAIINFLPIPVLDGGQLLFLAIEKIRGRRLNDEIVEKIGTFFFALLIVLTVVILFNDIVWLKG